MTATTDTAFDLDQAIRDLTSAPGKPPRSLFFSIVGALGVGEAFIFDTNRFPQKTAKTYVYLLNSKKEARYKTQRSLDGRHITIYRIA